MLHDCFHWLYSVTFVIRPFSSQQCQNHARDTPATEQASKMTINKRCSSQSQMDTIKIPSYLGCCYILRVIDHLSRYGYIGKFNEIESKEMSE